MKSRLAKKKIWKRAVVHCINPIGEGRPIIVCRTLKNVSKANILKAVTMRNKYCIKKGIVLYKQQN